MALSGNARLIEAGLTRFKADRERLSKLDKYLRGEQEGPYTPSSATAEYRLLAKRAVTNWMPLLVKTPAQALSVSGYRREGYDDAAPEWEAWQDNRMDARQAPVHRAALSYGLAYVTVLPDPFDLYRPVIRGVSPRYMYAAYEDPASDEFPVWALQIERMPEDYNADDRVNGWLYTDTTVTDVEISGANKGFKLGNSRRHGMGVCPVVRFAPDLDLEGRVTGVVEPMIPIQDRINQTVFDLLVAQTFGSFKVRTIAGMAPEFERDADGEIVYDPATGKPKALPIRADASRFMVAPDPDTKFGQLDETPLKGFLEAIESAMTQMAAISQTPPHYLLGSVVNLSAEALAAAESALTRAVQDYQDSFGESWEQVLALCSAVLGTSPDPNAEIQWMDHESRSLSQTVDALGKAVQMLQVPPRALWGRIPGVTSRDVESWTQMQEADDPGLRMADSIAQAMTRPTEPPPERVSDG